MKEEKKPDNLEHFFQRVLNDYEEDPGVDFWDRIIPNIPSKPEGKPPFVYKGWMVFLAFITGGLLSAFLFNWQSNTRLIEDLEKEIFLKETQIVELEETVRQIKTTYVRKEAIDQTINDSKIKTERTIRETSNSSDNNFNYTKKSTVGLPDDKKQFIKLETTRTTSVVPTTHLMQGSGPQRFVSSNNFDQLFKAPSPWTSNYQSMQLLFDKQLISNSKNSGIYRAEKERVSMDNFDQLPVKEKLELDYPTNTFDLTESDKKLLLPKPTKVISIGLGDDAPTAFISATINPLSSYKYNLKGHTPQSSSFVETAGITTSWNWSVYAGFENKSKGSFQVGLDFNKLVLFKESRHNIRFNAEEATRINGGYLVSLIQRSDGALGQIVVNANIFNKLRNDENDIQDGDLFSLSIRTEQPVQILRLPIMGGYRIDLSRRFYMTPKLGVSAVWKIREQTQLKSIGAFSDRINIQNADIFLTNTVTTESLEAIFRTEFGYRWKSKWYIVAEPRFKYSGKGLFNYKQVELVDSPFHLMFGIRFNID